jgi:50S ribosomal subunit-associated GTPase HflX
LETALDHYVIIAQKIEQMMEQMMERLLAEMKAGYEEMMIETKVQIDGFVSWMDTHQAKTEANHEEWKAAVRSDQERMEALMDVSLEMTVAYLEKIE